MKSGKLAARSAANRARRRSTSELASSAFMAAGECCRRREAHSDVRCSLRCKTVGSAQALLSDQKGKAASPMGSAEQTNDRLQRVALFCDAFKAAWEIAPKMCSPKHTPGNRPVDPARLRKDRVPRLLGRTNRTTRNRRCSQARQAKNAVHLRIRRLSQQFSRHQSSQSNCASLASVAKIAIAAKNSLTRHRRDKRGR